MLKVKVYNLEGKESSEMELPERIFGVKLNNDLVHQVVVAQMANARKVLADTKDKSEVSGGGRKPWRQKGTGRSRHGSIRSPLWKGGGITFGPTTARNFSKKINKKMKTKALFMVLSEKLKDKEILVIEDLNLKKVSTKEMSNIFSGLPLEKKKKILLSLDKKNENVLNSIKNIRGILAISSNSLNVLDLLKNKFLVINKKGIENIEKIYGKD